jgi:zinc transport system substrate-binding protein
VKRVLVLIMFLVLMPAVSQANIRIVGSIYTIGHFAQKVAGADVITVMPSGVDPHEYEPSPRDIGNVYSADLFIYHGGGIDPWAARLAPELIKKGIKVLSILGIADIKSADGNPHIWLSPQKAAREVLEIGRVLAELDEGSKELYTENAARYIKVLKEMDRKYASALSACELDTVVVAHDAYSVLAGQYAFKTISISGATKDNEPSFRHLASIVDSMRTLGIKYVLADQAQSRRLVDTIAAETGAGVLVLNPLGGLGQGTYESVMLENLSVLKRALKCQ